MASTSTPDGSVGSSSGPNGATTAINPGAQLPETSLHTLRHGWTTVAFHEDIDINIVSDRLNHSSTFITREIYTHVTPPMQSDAAERVPSRIFGRD
jgi:integrase